MHKMDIFTPWAIYVALQVLVYWTKAGTEATSCQSFSVQSATPSNEYKARVLDSLQFLLSILEASKRRVPLAALFLAQIHRDLANENLSCNMFVGFFSFKMPRL